MFVAKYICKCYDSSGENKKFRIRVLEYKIMLAKVETFTALILQRNGKSIYDKIKFRQRRIKLIKA